MPTTRVGLAWIIVAFVGGAGVVGVWIDRLLRLPLTPEWAQGVAGIGEAFAAIIALVLQGLDKRSRRRAIDARISAEAYALRRQLRSWIVGPPLTALVGAIGWATRTQAHFDRAEARFAELVRNIPEASADVAEAVRRAYVLFYTATQRVNEEVAVGGSPTGVATLNTAYAELEQGAQELDAAIDQELRDR